MPYSAAQMFDLVAGIEHYPEFLPWCKEVRFLSRTKDKVLVDMRVGTRLFAETFRTEAVIDRPRAINVQYKSGPLSHLSNAWAFKPVGSKQCEVSFAVDFDFRSPILRAAMNIFFDKALTKMVAAFEKRAKELYRRRISTLPSAYTNGTMK